MMSPRAAWRLATIMILCGVPLLLAAALAGGGSLSVLPGLVPAADGVPAATLGIGELEMGRDFGQPVTTPPQGPIAMVLLYGLLALCPAKFALLWILQRREARDMGSSAAAPASGDA